MSAYQVFRVTFQFAPCTLFVTFVGLHFNRWAAFYSYAQVVIIGYDETYPLWAISTAGAGGLEWNTHQIGQVVEQVGVRPKE